MKRSFIDFKYLIIIFFIKPQINVKDLHPYITYKVIIKSHGFLI